MAATLPGTSWCDGIVVFPTESRTKTQQLTKAVARQLPDIAQQHLDLPHPTSGKLAGSQAPVLSVDVVARTPPLPPGVPQGRIDLAQHRCSLSSAVFPPLQSTDGMFCNWRKVVRTNNIPSSVRSKLEDRTWPEFRSRLPKPELFRRPVVVGFDILLRVEEIGSTRE